MQNREMLHVFRNEINRWKPTWRYTFLQATHEEATEFVDAVERFMRWVDNFLSFAKR